MPDVLVLYYSHRGSTLALARQLARGIESVAGMNARDIGIAVVSLGGGRTHADDAIDPSVGLTEMVDVGTHILAGSPLCIVHAATDAAADQAIADVRRAVRIGEAAPVPKPVLMERVA